MKRILVTGAGGQLGTELQRVVWPEDWEVTAFDKAGLDLRDPKAIAARIGEGPWSAVINAAAYTAVDKAEADVVDAWSVNALGPAALAQACAAKGIALIQVSTDYVFDGSRKGRWEEGDPTLPLNVYGASKLGGELAVRTGGSRYAIVRTSWVVSAHGANFVKTMLRLGAAGNAVSVVADQTGAPTSAADLASALATIAVRLAEDRSAPSGTFHFSNAGEATWHSFAEAIFAAAAARGRPSPVVRPIATADYPRPATRPVNSLLSHRVIGEAFGIVPRDWREALEPIFDELIGVVS